MLFELLLWKIPISEQFPDTDMHGVFRLFCLLMVACCCRGQSEFVYPSIKGKDLASFNIIYSNLGTLRTKACMYNRYHTAENKLHIMIFFPQNER